ncbi:MAG: sensor histidine kinase [Deltaproteobacteria bacterium]|nr:MAG: sensor histidine kinase [Deltaproteobacteria bacterium]
MTRALARFRKSLEGMRPRKFVLLVAVTIFLAEFFVMLVLDYVNMPSHGLLHMVEAILDSTILLLFLTPLYFLVYRPFWEARQRYEEEIRQLNLQLMRIAEGERKRVSHELHDQVGQSLAALQFRISLLKRKLPEGHVFQRKLVEDMVRQVSDLGGDLRRMTHRLRPAMLDSGGVLPALEGLVADYRRMMEGVEIDLGCAGFDQVLDRLDEESELALFRVVQESLNNILNHSGARRVDILLSAQDSWLTVAVKDDGCGFDSGKVPVDSGGLAGVGLVGMRERVSALGGRFLVDSEPGKGTTVYAELPLGRGDEG